MKGAADSDAMPMPSSSWEAVVAEDGRTYYWHSETEEVRWDHPGDDAKQGGGSCVTQQQVRSLSVLWSQVESTQRMAYEMQRMLQLNLLERCCTGSMAQRLTVAFGQWRLCHAAACSNEMSISKGTAVEASAKKIASAPNAAKGSVTLMTKARVPTKTAPVNAETTMLRD